MHRGDEARSRRLVSQLEAGNPVTAAVVGGSCAWGHGASRIGEFDFASLFFAWLNATFPHPQHRFHNGAIPGTPSGYMALCTKWHVPPTADLVIVEYALNDGFDGVPLPEARYRRSFERLLRRLLALPRRPVVLPLMLLDFGHGKFWHSAEGDQATLAQYYGLPVVSQRAVVWEAMLRREAGFALSDVSEDEGRHPNDRGHRVLADLAAGYLQSVGRQLRRRPFGAEDDALVTQPLLPPMLPGNEAHDTQNCIMDGELRAAATDVSGFEWVEEGGGEGRRPKPGFVATRPGASLSVTFDSAATAALPEPQPGGGERAGGGAPPRRTAVTISHLRSYEHMGQAEVTCVAGCTCEAAVLDGHWDEHSSQMVGFKLMVSQASACTLTLTVLESTRSGEHKVKVNGVVVADEAGDDGFGPVDVLIDKGGASAADGFVTAQTR